MLQPDRMTTKERSDPTLTFDLLPFAQPQPSLPRHIHPISMGKMPRPAPQLAKIPSIVASSQAAALDSFFRLLFHTIPSTMGMYSCARITSNCTEKREEPQFSASLGEVTSM